MAHSPHKNRKGCGLCKPWKHRGYGRRERDPFSARRQLGKSRRSMRRDLDTPSERAS